LPEASQSHVACLLLSSGSATHLPLSYCSTNGSPLQVG
jgi:hypothetical protein